MCWIAAKTMKNISLSSSLRTALHNISSPRLYLTLGLSVQHRQHVYSHDVTCSVLLGSVQQQNQLKATGHERYSVLNLRCWVCEIKLSEITVNLFISWIDVIWCYHTITNIHASLLCVSLVVENENHCDFVKLREMLIRVNMEDLREQTHTRHYELYRRCKLEEMGFKDTDPDSKPFR